MSYFEITNGKVQRRDEDVHKDNATLQGNPGGVEFEIATYVDVNPHDLGNHRRIDQVEGIVLDALRHATKKNPALSFTLLVQPGEDVDPDELVPW